jgi:two-component system, chemotaxis family, CheB/CheR fusion protein
LYGYLREEVIGQRKEKFLRPIVPGSSFAALRQSLLDHGNWSGEIKHHTKDGRELTVESQIELIVLNGRRLVLESTRDITEQKVWRERQQLLVGELTHRVKNTLTVVQSLARQTLRTSQSNADFIERFDGRLAALASAHKLFVDSDWEGAELGALVKSQLQAHLGKDAARFEIEGEPVMLPPETATPLGLVLHELATNAAKYGALSSGDGKIKLSWRSLKGNVELLELVWREIDGPPVVTPERKGLGSTLIERGVPGATVKNEFLPDGLICTIVLPLTEISANDIEPEGRSG